MKRMWAENQLNKYNHHIIMAPINNKTTSDGTSITGAVLGVSFDVVTNDATTWTSEQARAYISSKITSPSNWISINGCFRSTASPYVVAIFSYIQGIAGSVSLCDGRVATSVANLTTAEFNSWTVSKDIVTEI